jgi:hypothetical protein
VSNLRRMRRAVARSADLNAQVATPAVEGNVGKRNAYACPVCGGLTVTIDVDPGVTPSNLACRAYGDVDLCIGVARSMWYRVNGLPIGEAQWEWYRPTEREARRLDAYQRSHVGMGGLLLRKRASPGNRA